MIAKLSGVVDSVSAESAVIDVNGVGYLVFASTRTLAALEPGEPASLLVETQMRDDRIQLYGFAETAERDWFRRLATVQGVGAKLALGILAVLPPDDLVAALAAGDRDAVVRTPGVGAKLAGRIVGEFKDRIGAIALAPAQATGSPGPGRIDTVAREAISALVNLGYSATQSFGAISGAARRLGPDAALEDLIRAGLAELAPNEPRGGDTASRGGEAR